MNTMPAANGFRAIVLMALVGMVGRMTVAGPGASPNAEKEAIWQRISVYFTPPPEYANDFGSYRSPLLFNDGRRVKTPADWQERRAEILATWESLLGKWPPLLEKPNVEFLDKVRRENFTQHKVRVEFAPDGRTTGGYLLVPDGRGPFPAVVIVYYEPETAIGEGKGADRDFACQLARRGFVALSFGHQPSLYYPSREQADLQPLHALGYAAANCCNALARLDFVDSKRIGVTGHSYGGKWAMFASCFYEKFACAAWSDPGIVFDEARPNVNYWEPWYLGWQPGPWRKRGIVTPDNPRTGAYKTMIETGRDLHELHALMAPRPFLVSGGAEDQPSRWRALNHSVAVNKLLGYENRVAMTNRKEHAPNAESNEVLCLFFEYFLK